MIPRTFREYKAVLEIRATRHDRDESGWDLDLMAVNFLHFTRFRLFQSYSGAPVNLRCVIFHLFYLTYLRKSQKSSS